jgi:hypothetical protein
VQLEAAPSISTSKVCDGPSNAMVSPVDVPDASVPQVT